ncbi:MAG: hypothetical protein RR595_09805 [Lysinibacillus sp.]
MFEISKKQTVKTRKAHECYGCCNVINKGDAAIYVRGKEDDKHVNFHMHAHCHILATKQKLYEEGFAKGAVKILQQESNDFSTMEAEYPF